MGKGSVHTFRWAAAGMTTTSVRAGSGQEHRAGIAVCRAEAWVLGCGGRTPQRKGEGHHMRVKTTRIWPVVQVLGFISSYSMKFQKQNIKPQEPAALCRSADSSSLSSIRPSDGARQ